MTNRVCLFFSLILSVGFFSANNLEAQDKPNVLFVAVDDLRPTLGAYGDEVAITPNIDRLSDESVIFERHYVQQASCAPSRTSMLTGFRPDEIGVTDHNTHFRDTRPDVVTLPQLFKNNGYESVGIGKIFHWRSGFQDSESWHREHYSANMGREYQYVLPENQTGDKEAATEMADVHDGAYMEGIFTDLAIDALNSFKNNQTPFFLAVGYFRPHLPFVAPTRYWDLYDRESFYPTTHQDRPTGAPEIAFHNNDEIRGYNDIPDDGPIAVDKVKELRHGYYASISYIDAQVGKLLETLDELGLRENTIIVFWGDHGFHLGEQSIWAKSTAYELDARSPLMISAPGVSKEGKHSRALVEALDIYPTIVDLAGIDPVEPLSGKSLKPLLMNPDIEWDQAAFNQFPRPYQAAIGGQVPKTHMGYSVRTDNWRYTAWYNYATGEFDYPELYSMKDNEVEMVNLAGSQEYSDIQNQLHEHIKNYANK